jgi:hypothetical protein
MAEEISTVDAIVPPSSIFREDGNMAKGIPDLGQVDSFEQSSHKSEETPTPSIRADSSNEAIPYDEVECTAEQESVSSATDGSESAEPEVTIEPTQAEPLDDKHLEGNLEDPPVKRKSSLLKRISKRLSKSSSDEGSEPTGPPRRSSHLLNRLSSQQSRTPPNSPAKKRISLIKRLSSRVVKKPKAAEEVLAAEPESLNSATEAEVVEDVAKPEAVEDVAKPEEPEPEPIASAADPVSVEETSEPEEPEQIDSTSEEKTPEIIIEWTRISTIMCSVPEGALVAESEVEVVADTKDIEVVEKSTPVTQAVDRAVHASPKSEATGAKRDMSLMFGMLILVAMLLGTVFPHGIPKSHQTVPAINQEKTWTQKVQPKKKRRKTQA